MRACEDRGKRPHCGGSKHWSVSRRRGRISAPDIDDICLSHRGLPARHGSHTLVLPAPAISRDTLNCRRATAQGRQLPASIASQFLCAPDVNGARQLAASARHHSKTARRAWAPGSRPRDSWVQRRAMASHPPAPPAACRHHPQPRTSQVHASTRQSASVCSVPPASSHSPPRHHPCVGRAVVCRCLCDPPCSQRWRWVWCGVAAGRHTPARCPRPPHRCAVGCHTHGGAGGCQACHAVCCTF